MKAHKSLPLSWNILLKKSAGASANNMDKSPLNKLSAELRNQIYEFALQKFDPIEIEIIAAAPHSRRSSVHSNQDTRACMALTKTCKQIHKESTGIFYSVNTFRVLANMLAGERWDRVKHVIEDEEGTRWRKWFKIIGERRFTLLSDVEVDLGWVDRIGTGVDNVREISILKRCMQAMHSVFARTNIDVKLRLTIEGTEGGVRSESYTLSIPLKSPERAQEERARYEEARLMLAAVFLNSRRDAAGQQMPRHVHLVRLQEADTEFERAAMHLQLRLMNSEDAVGELVDFVQELQDRQFQNLQNSAIFDRMARSLLHSFRLVL